VFLSLSKAVSTYEELKSAYPELIDAWKQGNLVFFCGAGISCRYHYPSFGELADRTYRFFQNENAEKFKELRKYFVSQIDNLQELIDICEGNAEQAIKKNYEENPLILASCAKDVDKQLFFALLKREFSRDVLKGEYPQLHDLIITLSRHGDTNQKRLVTTNIDPCFEICFPKQQLTMSDTFIAEGASFEFETDKLNKIVFLHGSNDSLQNDRYEEIKISSLSYFDRGSEKTFGNLFDNSDIHVLFLGYGMDDYIRTDKLKSKSISQSNNKTQHYCLIKEGENNDNWQFGNYIKQVFFKEYDDILSIISSWVATEMKEIAIPNQKLPEPAIREIRNTKGKLLPSSNKENNEDFYQNLKDFFSDGGKRND
jgi:NAD-dependent SIR2 family protein deacetylase